MTLQTGRGTLTLASTLWPVVDWLSYRETLSYDDFLAFRRALQQEILRIQISSSPSSSPSFSLLLLLLLFAQRGFLDLSVVRVHFEQYDLDGNNDLSPREFGMFLVSHVNQVQYSGDRGG